jgi:hypothetical protein
MAVILVHRYSASAGFGDNRHTDVIVIVVVTVVIARFVAATSIGVDKYSPAAYRTLQVEQQTRHEVSSHAAGTAGGGAAASCSGPRSHTGLLQRPVKTS